MIHAKTVGCGILVPALSRFTFTTEKDVGCEQHGLSLQPFQNVKVTTAGDFAYNAFITCRFHRIELHWSEWSPLAGMGTWHFLPSSPKRFDRATSPLEFNAITQDNMRKWRSRRI